MVAFVAEGDRILRHIIRLFSARMDKRYQVFLSSTYADLKDERQKVIQALMEMDCIPSGMELFPATDEEQWEFIKKVIDDCDYYLLIIGGRYGSINTEGISYTEQEYDYAIEKGLKVIAFLHEDPDLIPAGKTEKDPDLSEKLMLFRSKVQKNRLVKYWKTADALPSLVALSLMKTIKIYPAVGWVRATGAGSSELLSEINTLRKENEKLRANAQSYVAIENIAGLNESAELYGNYTVSRDLWADQFTTEQEQVWKHVLTWNQIFALIAPYLFASPSTDSNMQEILKKSVLEDARIHCSNSTLNNQVFQTVKIQFMVYGLVEFAKKSGALFCWHITEKGKALMMELRVVKKEVSENE